MTKNRWISDLHWRRDGQYSRSERTQNALLDAAEALVLQHGAENVSVQDIIRSSGCSVGSFYHQFKDKTALFYALYDRMNQTFVEVTREGLRSERWQGANIKAVLEGYLEMALMEKQGRPAFKVADMLVSSTYPELREHYVGTMKQANLWLQNLLMERQSEISHPSPKKATALVVDQISALMRARLDPLQSTSMLCQFSDRVFIRMIVENACAYLRCETPTHAPD